MTPQHPGEMAGSPAPVARGGTGVPFWPERPFDRAGLRDRVLPFGATAGLAVASIALSLPVEQPGFLATAALGTGLLLALVLLIDWRRLPTWADAVIPLAYFPIIGLLRASDGGASSGFGPLVMLPIFWLALYGTRPQLLAGIAVMTLTFVVPILVIGEPNYPSGDWRRTFINVGVAGVVGFTTQRLVARTRSAAGRLHVASHQDPLTGIGNRRAFDAIISDAFRDAGPGDRQLSVAALDLDHFKAFNDEHGHAAGDALLRACATAWQGCLRAGDDVLRLGGEEFVVILPGCGPETATDIVERLRRATPPEITVSAGIAASEGDGSPASLLARADRALYAAKAAGRDRTHLAD